MTDQTPRIAASLLERAAAARAFAPPPVASPPPPAASPPRAATIPAFALPPRGFVPQRHAAIDRDLLIAGGFILPGAPVTGLAEEYRIIKRPLLAAADADGAGARLRRILVCSPQPGDGKTFSAVNLALSIAAEKDRDVLLVDADFAKPSLAAVLGLPDGPGLLDALADPARDIGAAIVATDVPQLSVLTAGTRSHDDTELLASPATARLFDALTDANPRRIVIFDSPPALAASTAASLAMHVGQIAMVVRADRTAEAELREAVALLEGRARISLLLNATSYAHGGTRFGAYYGQKP